jgi:hypothetical protein
MIIPDIGERIVRAIKIDALRDELETTRRGGRTARSTRFEGANPGPAITLFSGQR